MEEKRPAWNRPVRRRPLPKLLAFIILCAIAFIYFFSPMVSHPYYNAQPKHQSQDDESRTWIANPSSAGTLVPLEAHIMSKCPDARDCLQEMVLPTMQRVYNKVNFTLSFIGTPTQNDGVDCKHGPSECMGNILELCAASLYPDPKTYLGFTMCISRDYKAIPQRNLIEDCSLEHAIDFEKLNECATRDDGAYGIGMLRESVRRTSDVGVTKSCTVRLNQETYCIRDGGEWSDCPSGPAVNDLVIAIEKLYRSS